jgi:hypothetical protein
VSEEHRKPFDGEIKIKFLNEGECDYTGIPGLVTIELSRVYHTEAKWVGERSEIERGLGEIGRAYMTMHRHWEMRRLTLLEEDRKAMESSIVEPAQRDLGTETDEHQVVL